MMNPREFVKSFEKVIFPWLSDCLFYTSDSTQPLLLLQAKVRELKEYLDSASEPCESSVQEDIKKVAEMQHKHELNMKIQALESKLDTLSQDLAINEKQIKELKKENELLKFTDRHIRSEFDSLRAEFESLRHFVTQYWISK